jgi:WhiB family redox-sensing transcriptional regulator
MDWRDAALCRNLDPELFFPVSEIGPGAVQTARAKEICRDCPVRVACLRFALDSGQDYGIYGGYSAAERRALRSRRPAA